jgi:twitching motility protein PilT
VDTSGPIEPGRLLAAAMAAGAEELLLSEGRPPFLRLGGRLRPSSSTTLQAEHIGEFLRAHFPALDPARCTALLRFDFRSEDPPVRGRVVVAPHARGLAVAVRLHPLRARALDELGVGPGLRECLQGEQGLILVAGQQRSGVTETLGAILTEVATASDRLVVVLDEDLEHAADTGPAVVVRRRVGEHTIGYANGLRSAFHQQADAIVVGEVQSSEVFDLCLRAAEAGRLVIAGLRARSAVDAIERVVSHAAPSEVARCRTALAGVLRCVVAVDLLPAASGGRVLASELLRIDDAARVVLRDGSLSQLELLLRLDGRGSGRSMDACVQDLLARRLIHFHEALGRVDNKLQLLSALPAEGEHHEGSS